MLEYLRTQAEAMPDKSRGTYRQAVAALASYLCGRADACGFPDESHLGEWLVQLNLRGLSYRTATLYYDAVSGLYSAGVRSGELPATDSFGTVRSRLRSLGAEGWRGSVGSSDLDRVLALTKSSSHQSGDTRIGVDLLLMSLLGGCRPLVEVADMKVDILPELSAEERRVAERHRSARRRYIFGLCQSGRTPRQLSQAVAAAVVSVLSGRGIRVIGGLQGLIESLWCLGAMRLGYSGGEAVGALGHVPSGLPVLSVCVPSESSVGLQESVGRMFVSERARWYAMRLRRHVAIEDVERRLSELPSVHPRPELFYPYEEIARRLHRRLVFEQKPVIRDVAFFRSRQSDIAGLFTILGDLAWCYRHPGGTYAAVDQAEFEKFQRTIGRFTPDYEVGPIGSLSLRAGERVTYVGGLLGGLPLEVCGEDSGSGVYRFRFTGDNGIEWRIQADPRTLTPAPANI